LKVEISGTAETYVYDWQIINDPKNPLLPNRPITKFAVKLFDIQSSLEGNEQVRFFFNDYSGINDLAGNSLVSNSYAEENPAPFVYVSPSEASAASGGGTSLKYTFMSVFSFNIALKILMNGSM
jgi:hypothetical protein